MSKFNAKQISKNVATSYEGGKVFTRDVNDALLNFMFGSYLEDQYYETKEEQQTRFIELLDKVAETEGYKFIGKLAHFSRNEMGMRSVSTLAAAWLNDKSMQAKRDFYRGFFHRPDDVAETFAAVDMLGQKRSHGLVRGAADYISSLNDYTLGKYKLNGKDYNMFDIINITHAWSDSIQKYKDGTLAAPETWEVKVSGAKNSAEKAAEWKSLVENKKLGYLALMRNLRNIRNAGSEAGWYTNEWIESNLIPQITNFDSIKKSLIFPYQIYAAVKALTNGDFSSISLPLLNALNEAFRISIGNMPELSGKSLIILDVSGSMSNIFSENSSFSIKEICAVYSAAIYLNTDSTFIKFGDYYKEKTYDKTMNVFSLINKMQENENCGYGTRINPVLSSLVEPYDRIFIFSDMQVMNTVSYWYNKDDKSAQTILNKYWKDIGKKVPVYSFDLSNYRTQITNPDCNYLKYFTGLNEYVMKFIELYENNYNLIDYINQLYPY